MAHAMLREVFTMHRSTLASLALALAIVAASLVAREAGAQTINFASGVQYPYRLVGPDNKNLGFSTRPINLTPLGISYADCIQDQTLQFQLSVSGFSGQNLEVWAGANVDCTMDANRGVGQVPTCWLVGNGITALPALNATPETINVRVQDAVGWQQGAPSDPTYHPLGSSACTAQPSFAAVPITLFFLAISPPNTNVSVTPLEYVLNTDMVGPPAPVGVSTASGQTLITVNWTANTDTSTVGYDIYIDPPIGVAPDAVASGGYVCVDASTSGTTSDATTSDAASSTVLSVSVAEDAELEDAADVAVDAQDGATTDAAEGASIAEAGEEDASGLADTGTRLSDAASTAGFNSCVNKYGGGIVPETTGSCSDPNLSAGTMVTGSTTTTVTEADGATVSLVEDGGVTTGGGISQVSSTYLIPVNSAAGMLVPSKTQQNYTITDLYDYQTYAVSVSAVDAYGNIGPPSSQWCDFPAPVNDFWQLYSEANGNTSGLCALEAVGAPVSSTVAFGAMGAMIAGIVRRRRRQR